MPETCDKEMAPRNSAERHMSHLSTWEVQLPLACRPLRWHWAGKKPQLEAVLLLPSVQGMRICAAQRAASSTGQDGMDMMSWDAFWVAQGKREEAGDLLLSHLHTSKPSYFMAGNKPNKLGKTPGPLATMYKMAQLNLHNCKILDFIVPEIKEVEIKHPSCHYEDVDSSYSLYLLCLDLELPSCQAWPKTSPPVSMCRSAIPC